MTTAESSIRVYGADWCRDYRRTTAHLEELAIAHTTIDTEADPAAAETAREISSSSNIPVVVYPDASHQVEPSNAEVELKLRELGRI